MPMQIWIHITVVHTYMVIKIRSAIFPMNRKEKKMVNLTSHFGDITTLSHCIDDCYKYKLSFRLAVIRLRISNREIRRSWLIDLEEMTILMSCMTPIVSTEILKEIDRAKENMVQSYWERVSQLIAKILLNTSN
jgi:hypothetical protein